MGPLSQGRRAAPAVRVSQGARGLVVGLRLGADVYEVPVSRAVGLAYLAVCDGIGAPADIRAHVAAAGATPPATDEALRRALNRLGQAITRQAVGSRFQDFVPRQAQHRWAVAARAQVVRELP
ncbi:MAG: hypothetical protein R3F59_21815 [Myxococcota bacterium]